MTSFCGTRTRTVHPPLVVRAACRSARPGRSEAPHELPKRLWQRLRRLRGEDSQRLARLLVRGHARGGRAGAAAREGYTLGSDLRGKSLRGFRGSLVPPSVFWLKRTRARAQGGFVGASCLARWQGSRPLPAGSTRWTPSPLWPQTGPSFHPPTGPAPRRRMRAASPRGRASARRSWRGRYCRRLGASTSRSEVFDPPGSPFVSRVHRGAAASAHSGCRFTPPVRTFKLGKKKRSYNQAQPVPLFPPTHSPTHCRQPGDLAIPFSFHTSF